MLYFDCLFLFYNYLFLILRFFYDSINYYLSSTHEPQFKKPWSNAMIFISLFIFLDSNVQKYKVVLKKLTKAAFI